MSYAGGSGQWSEGNGGKISDYIPVCLVLTLELYKYVYTFKIFNEINLN